MSWLASLSGGGSGEQDYKDVAKNAFSSPTSLANRLGSRSPSGSASGNPPSAANSVHSRRQVSAINSPEDAEVFEQMAISTNVMVQKTASGGGGSAKSSTSANKIAQDALSKADSILAFSRTSEPPAGPPSTTGVSTMSNSATDIFTEVTPVSALHQTPVLCGVGALPFSRKLDEASYESSKLVAPSHIVVPDAKTPKTPNPTLTPMDFSLKDGVLAARESPLPPLFGSAENSTASTIKSSQSKRSTPSQRRGKDLDLKNNDNSFCVIGGLIVDFFQAKLGPGQLEVKLNEEDKKKLERLAPPRVRLSFIEAVRYRLANLPKDSKSSLYQLTVKCQVFGFDKEGLDNPLITDADLKTTMSTTTESNHPKLQPSGSLYTATKNVADFSVGSDSFFTNARRSIMGMTLQSIEPSMDTEKAFALKSNLERSDDESFGFSLGSSFKKTTQPMSIRQAEGISLESSLDASLKMADSNAASKQGKTDVPNLDEATTFSGTKKSLMSAPPNLEEYNPLKQKALRRVPVDPSVASSKRALKKTEISTSQQSVPDSTTSRDPAGISISDKKQLQQHQNPIQGNAPDPTGSATNSFIPSGSIIESIQASSQGQRSLDPPLSSNKATGLDPDVMSMSAKSAMDPSVCGKSAKTASSGKPIVVADGAKSVISKSLRDPSVIGKLIKSPMTVASSKVGTVNNVAESTKTQQQNKKETKPTSQPIEHQNTTQGDSILSRTTTKNKSSEVGLATQQLMAELQEASTLMAESKTQEAAQFWHANVVELQARLQALHGDTMSIGTGGATLSEYATSTASVNTDNNTSFATNNFLSAAASDVNQVPNKPNVKKAVDILERNQRLLSQYQNAEDHNPMQNTMHNPMQNTMHNPMADYRPPVVESYRMPSPQTQEDGLEHQRQEQPPQQEQQPQQEQSSDLFIDPSMEGIPMVDVVAPADLPGGYHFEAEIEGRRFLATVPAGGVRKGETFSCYMRDLEKVGSDIPVGRWRDGIFSCCTHGIGPVICNALLCPLVLLSQILTRVNFDVLGRRNINHGARASTMWSIIGFWMLINSALLIGYFTKWWLALEITNADFSALGFVNLVYLIFVVYVTASARGNLREKYFIRETFCYDLEDCCCATFCLPCTLCQMARHTADYDEYEAVCCNHTGLPDSYQPEESVATPRNKYIV